MPSNFNSPLAKRLYDWYELVVWKNVLYPVKVACPVRGKGHVYVVEHFEEAWS